MPLVNVMVNTRAYTIACDEGEEEHLKELARHVDEKVQELLGSVGQVGDTRLILMAALLLADEHNDLARRLEARTNELRELSAQHDALSERLEQGDGETAEFVEGAAKRIEDVAARLRPA